MKRYNSWDKVDALSGIGYSLSETLAKVTFGSHLIQIKQTIFKKKSIPKGVSKSRRVR